MLFLWSAIFILITYYLNISSLSSNFIECIHYFTVQSICGELSSPPWVMFYSKLGNLSFISPSFLPFFLPFLSFPAKHPPPLVIMLFLFIFLVLRNLSLDLFSLILYRWLLNSVLTMPEACLFHSEQLQFQDRLYFAFPLHPTSHSFLLP